MHGSVSRGIGLALLVACALAASAAPAGAAQLFAAPAGRAGIASLFRFDVAGVECSIGLTVQLLPGAIEKVPGELIGTVTHAIIPCAGSVLVNPLALPWSLTFSSIAGTLPNGMTGLLVTLRGVRIGSSNWISCLYCGDIGLRILLDGENPYLTDLVVTLENQLRLLSGGFFCPNPISLIGVFELAPQQQYTRL